MYAQQFPIQGIFGQSMISKSQDTANRDADQLLVRRVQAGDRKAYDLLVLKYQNKIMGLIHQVVKDPNDVPDIAQEAFVKAYRALKNFRGDSAFYTWLYRIALNCAKNALAKQGKLASFERHQTEEGEQDWNEAYSVDASPEQIVASEKLKSKIYEVIEQLPAELKQAIQLREFDGFSYEEIAAIMECPIGTVRSRIFRARETIDLAIEPYLMNGRGE